MSQSASKDRIIDNAPDAARVSGALSLFPALLLREDERVQAAFRDFQNRAERAWLAGALANRGAVQTHIVGELHHMIACVAELGLAQYRWLPGALLREFCAASFGRRVEYSLPDDGEAWLARGKRPKNGPKQSEDLKRNLMWLYRRTVKTPHDGKARLQREFGIASWNTVDKGIKRAQYLLSKIDVPSKDSTL